MSLDTNELPEGWSDITLNVVGKWQTGGTPSRSKDAYFGGSIPWVKSGDLRDGIVSSTDETVTEQGIGNSAAKVIPKGSVCVALYGATIGKAGILGIDAATNQACASCTVDPRIIENRLLFHYLISQRRQFIAAGQGGAQPNLTNEIVRNWPLSLPPLPEQRRIVAKIEALQIRSSMAREALESIPPLLEQFRQSMLAAAFRGDLTADWRDQHHDVEPASVLLERIRDERRRKWEKAELAKFKANGKVPKDESWKERYLEPEPADDAALPVLPQGWCWVPACEVVDDEADIRYGIVQPGPPLKSGVPYVRGVDIQDGQILLDQLWNTSPQIAQQYRNASLKTGDVLLGIIRHLKVAIVPKELDGGNMARTTARFRPSKLISSEYLASYLASPLCQNWLKSNYRGGTSMPKVNIADVIRLPIPLAPIREQSMICDRIRCAQRQYAKVRSQILPAINESNEFDQSVLAKAFRGELVPQNPDDEPASALLERIQAERAGVANGKPASGRRKQVQ